MFPSKVRGFEAIGRFEFDNRVLDAADAPES